jgi:uncharacterized membrane protein (DUF4010 family)
MLFNFEPNHLLPDESTLLGLCIALGIGLLVGAERERRKGSGSTRGAAGIRSFTVTSLLGAVAMLLGGSLLLAVTVLIIGVLAVVSYQRTRDDDPGTTTEIALVLICLLGGLAVVQSALAAGIGVTLTVLLAARNRMHFFVSGVLTERELHDALLFLAVTLIVMPLAPDHFIGPFAAFNPHAIARLVVLVMAISALGYIATRLLGERFGLPLAGFAAGFISSTATIHAMGARASKQPEQMRAAVAGAVLSSIATIIQMAVVIASIQPVLLNQLLKPLVFGGVAACLYSLVFILKGVSPVSSQQNSSVGRAFDLKTALGFAAIVSIILVISAGLNSWLGARGMLLAAGLTGLVDPHATAASVASLVVNSKLSAEAAQLAVLIGLTTNSAMKAVVSFYAGRARYAAYIVPGLALVIGAVWFGSVRG